MATDFGQDMRVVFEDGVFDFDPTGAIDTPERALVMSLARRFVVRRGDLFYDENYGLDLRDFLNQAMTLGSLFLLQSKCAAEVEKDERVQSASSVARFDDETQTLFVRIDGMSSLGPFALTLSASALSVELLETTLPAAAP